MVVAPEQAMKPAARSGFSWSLTDLPQRKPAPAELPSSPWLAGTRPD
jgi:hypothetical protein